MCIRDRVKILHNNNCGKDRNDLGLKVKKMPIHPMASRIGRQNRSITYSNPHSADNQKANTGTALGLSKKKKLSIYFRQVNKIAVCKIKVINFYLWAVSYTHLTLPTICSV
eukprot:TRINITY_DN17109_c0_g2_i2.p1 TRINITY_DN17109_c0_g2~~TRINITY_DN17109_c0_g2_i2.p1  ORF type:complete len:111 (+),score=2.05 TRINITY_DN17109_c0_g2_i2:69-401(+)